MNLIHYLTLFICYKHKSILSLCHLLNSRNSMKPANHSLLQGPLGCWLRYSIGGVGKVTMVFLSLYKHAIPLGVHGLSTGLQELKACTHLPPSQIFCFLIDMCKWQLFHNTLATCVSRVSSWLFCHSIDGQLSSDYAHNDFSTVVIFMLNMHDTHTWEPWLLTPIYFSIWEANWHLIPTKISFSCTNWLEWIQ